MLADMVTEIEVSKSMNHRAIYEYHKSHKKHNKNASLLALMAKRNDSSSCLKVVLDAVQIHGSFGFIKEYSIERYYRDTKLLDIAGGTNEMLKVLIA